MRVAVVGARGQLGAAIVRELAPFDVVPLTRAEMDIADGRAVAAAIDRARPEVIINCAAFNEVDAAEDRPVDALNVNAFAVRALARAAASCDATLVHFSTDFVFDGAAQSPYSEDAPPNPRSVYAASKLLGEWFAEDAPRAYVLRVESLFGRAPGGPTPKGSAASIVNAIRAGQPVRVFEDRVISPTYILDGARATRELLERGAPPGLYHCVNSGRCSWLEFAQEAARRLKIAAKLVPVKMSDVTLRATRPRFCAMSNEKLRRVGIEMPTWQDALARYIALVGEGR